MHIDMFLAGNVVQTASRVVNYGYILLMAPIFPF